MHNYSWNVYFFTLHVSGDYVPVIKRNNCMYATLGTCSSGVHPAYLTVIHPYIITSTKFRINRVVSPDDRLTVARNM